MFESILDYISRTNLFNFVIFAGIIIFLCVKLDLSGFLEKGKESVEEDIKDSDIAKENSEAKLEKIEDLVAHLEDDIEEIIRESEENAVLVGNKIIADANKTVENIKNNSIKIIENKTAVIKNDIMKRASLASIEVARKHIIAELDNNLGLHNKLIDESVEAINGLEG